MAGDAAGEADPNGNYWVETLTVLVAGGAGANSGIGPDSGGGVARVASGAAAMRVIDAPS